jgi:hypothetical protein
MFVVVVGLMLIFADNLLAVYAYVTNVYVEFDRLRVPLRDAVPVEQVLPSRVGDFLRTTLSDTVDEKHRFRSVSAFYTGSNSEQIHITATLSLDGTAQLWRWSGQKRKVFYQVNESASYPFALGIEQRFRDVSYDVRWLNGNWVFFLYASSTLRSNYHSLLNFSNGYPY